MLIYNFKMASKAISKNIFRSFLAIIQIAIGMAIFVAFVNLNFQMLSSLKEDYGEAHGIMTFHYDLSKLVRTSYDTLPIPPISPENYEKLKNSDELEYSSVWRKRNFVPAIINNLGCLINTVQYVDVDFPSIFDLELLEGDFFTADDIKNVVPHILLEADFAQKAFGSIGQAMGKSIFIESNLSGKEKREFFVTGIFKNTEYLYLTDETGLISALIPWNSTPDLFLADLINPLVFSLHKGMDANDGRRIMARMLDVDVDAFDLKFVERSLGDHLLVAKKSARPLGIFSFIALIVVAISMLSINTVNTMEKNKDISLKRALGASKMNVVGQILLESAIYSFLGGVLGLLFGYFLQFAFMKGSSLPYAVGYNTNSFIRIETAIISILVAILVGVFFSLYPAWQAANIPPTEALKEE